MSHNSWYDEVSVASPIEVFALTQAYNEDKSAKKVNLGVGAYRTDEGKPWVLPVVRTAESQMAGDNSLNHEYLPVIGLPEYRKASVALLLGQQSSAILENRVDGIQCCGGTGALRLGLAFLNQQLKLTACYITSPTWENHRGIANSCGFTEVKEYRYWDAAERKINFEGLKTDLNAAAEGSVVILHACAHNPTGMDPTMDQWKEILKIVKSRKLFPFFDCAYQGFSSGDLDKDAAAVRLFDAEGMELLAAQSFSKNFGLYNERVGNLVIVVKNAETLQAIRSQMALLARVMWSNPPAHGCRVVATILNNELLRSAWMASVKAMAERILLMRKQLYEHLKALGTPGTWDHIIQQSGMFSYTGLSAKQTEHLKCTHHIYMLKSGRINMCGITTHNIEHVATSIHDAVENIADDAKL